MASFSDQLRQRLAQISESNDSATTWEQLKRQREKQKQATLEAIGQINAQTDMYRNQLANYAKIYGSGRVTPGPAAPVPTKKKQTKKKSSGSLGDALGGFADIGGIF